MNDFIIKLLDLKEEDLDSIDSITHMNHADFLITLKIKDHVCPRCGSFTHFIKDYKTRKLRHKILINFDSTIFYRQRRYLCKNCGASFIEINPFTGNRYVMTPATIINILDDLKPYTSTYSSVAKKYGISVSTVIDIFDKHVQIPRKKLTEILCWDEFYFNRHAEKKYAFMIMDFKKKYIIDIVESRWNEDLYHYLFNIPLNERNNVRYIIIDMYKNYKLICNVFFKNTTICVDPFHAIKKVNDSLNALRKRVMRTYKDDQKDSEEYKLLKNRCYLILKNRDDLKNDEYKYDQILKAHVTESYVAEKTLKINPLLDEAYKIKEEFISLNDETPETFKGREAKEKELNSLIRRMMISGITEMIDCAKTLKNWKEEILNSFTWFEGRRLSNGPIEGKNNYIKKIISSANGMQNFERARNKFIYSQNLYEKYTATEHKKKIKRVGKPRGKYNKKRTK